MLLQMKTIHSHLISWPIHTSIIQGKTLAPIQHLVIPFPITATTMSRRDQLPNLLVYELQQHLSTQKITTMAPRRISNAGHHGLCSWPSSYRWVGLSSDMVASGRLVGFCSWGIIVADSGMWKVGVGGFRMSGLEPSLVW